MCVILIVLKVLYSYSIGFGYILTGLFGVGGLGPAVAFCSQVSKTLSVMFHYNS